MRSVERVVVAMAVGSFLWLGADVASAQSADTVARRTTAEELHAQRRAWLEARRSGTLSDVPPVYGSAVVGPTAGAAHIAPPLGGTPVICTGILAGPGHTYPGSVSFRGDCRPQLGFNEGFGQQPWGVQESAWNGWGWSPLWPFGWSVDPSSGYAFSWPGYAGGECVRVRIEPAGAPPIDMQVALQALGIAEAADLDLAIEARLANGQSVDLYSLDGRRVRIEPGTLLDDIRVLPCSR